MQDATDIAIGKDGVRRCIGFHLDGVDEANPVFQPLETAALWSVVQQTGLALRIRWIVFPPSTMPAPGHVVVYVLADLPPDLPPSETSSELVRLLALIAPHHRFEAIRAADELRFATAPFGKVAWSLALDRAPDAPEPRILGFRPASWAGNDRSSLDGLRGLGRAEGDLDQALFLLVASPVATMLEWEVAQAPLATPRPAFRPAGTDPDDRTELLRCRVRWSGTALPEPRLTTPLLARAIGASGLRFVSSDPGNVPGLPIDSALALPLPSPVAASAVTPTLRSPVRLRLPDVGLPGEGDPIGATIDGRTVRISQTDRLRHEWIVGQTGTGKSTLLLNRILADLEGGQGFALFDPHGDLVEAVRRVMPASRRDDVVLVDATGQADSTPSLNLLACTDVEQVHARAGQILEMISGLWPREFVGPVFQQAVTNALVVLGSRFENPGTLADLPRLFLDDAFRKQFLGSFPAEERVPEAVAWFTKSYDNYSSTTRSEALDYYVSKFNFFFVDPMLRRILGQPRSTIDVRAIMDRGGILLCNLSRGGGNPMTTTLLTWVFLQATLNAALSRTDVPQAERRPFFIYCDEFQRVVGPSTAALLSEVRKYCVGLILAHQFVDQLPEDTLNAVLGNVGTKVIFRLGARDAARIASYQPTVPVEELIRLPNFVALVELLVDGVPTSPFTVRMKGPPGRSGGEG